MLDSKEKATFGSSTLAELKIKNKDMKADVESTIDSHKKNFKKLFCTKPFNWDLGSQLNQGT